MSDSADKKRRLPDWLKKSIPPGASSASVHRQVTTLGLHTVCHQAMCPNRPECFARGTATFMILGDTCTRSCRYCGVSKGRPGQPRTDEPEAVATAAAKLGLGHVVVTSVTRDDLPDGGASVFADTITAIRPALPEATVEVLIPDFAGCSEALEIVLVAGPDVLNHNLETAPRLYPTARPQANYRRSLELLNRVALFGGKPIHIKSGFMVGLGETDAEVTAMLADLKAVGCEIVTIGQYLAPSENHLPVDRFIPPEQFAAWEVEGRDMGISSILAGPFVRSSYMAEDALNLATSARKAPASAIESRGTWPAG